MRRSLLIGIGLCVLGAVLLQLYRDAPDPLGRLGREAAAPAGRAGSGSGTQLRAAPSVVPGGARAPVARHAVLAPFAWPRPELDFVQPPAETAIAVRFMDTGSGGPVRGERLMMYAGAYSSDSLLGVATTDVDGRVLVDPENRPGTAMFELQHRLGEAVPSSFSAAGLPSTRIRLRLGEAAPGDVVEVWTELSTGPQLKVTDAVTGRAVEDVGLSSAWHNLDEEGGLGWRLFDRVGWSSGTRMRAYTRLLSGARGIYTVPSGFLRYWNLEGPAPEPGQRELHVFAPGYRVLSLSSWPDWEWWGLDPPDTEPRAIELEPIDAVALQVLDGRGELYGRQLELIERSSQRVVGVWKGEQPLAFDADLLEADEDGELPIDLFVRDQSGLLPREQWSLEPASPNAENRTLVVHSGLLRLEFSGLVPELAATQDGERFVHPVKAGSVQEFRGLTGGRWWIGPPEALPLVSRLREMNEHLSRWPLVRIVLKAKTAEEVAHLGGLSAVELESGETRVIVDAWTEVVDGLSGRVEVEGVEPSDLRVFPTWLDQRIPIVYEKPENGGLPVDAEGRFERAGATLAPEGYLIGAVAREVNKYGREYEQLELLGSAPFAPNVQVQIVPAAIEVTWTGSEPGSPMIKTAIDGRWSFRGHSMPAQQPGETRRWFPLPSGKHELWVWSSGDRITRKIRVGAGETVRVEASPGGVKSLK